MAPTAPIDTASGRTETGAQQSAAGGAQHHQLQQQPAYAGAVAPKFKASKQADASVDVFEKQVRLGALRGRRKRATQPRNVCMRPRATFQGMRVGNVSARSTIILSAYFE